MVPKANFLRDYWRPMMAMQYLVVCIFDFVIAPVGWAILQAHLHIPLVQWVPSTLGSGGTYHLAMGAVLGVAAWTRSMDKTDNLIKTAYISGSKDTTKGTLNPRYIPPEAEDEPTPKKPLPGME